MCRYIFAKRHIAVLSKRDYIMDHELQYTPKELLGFDMVRIPCLRSSFATFSNNLHTSADENDAVLSA